MQPSIEERADELKKKLEELEAKIKAQSKENQKLLSNFHERLEGNGAAKRKEQQPPSAEKRRRLGQPSAGGDDLRKTKELKPMVAIPEDLVRFIDTPIAVVVFACNRPSAIKAHLDKLLKYDSDA